MIEINILDNMHVNIPYSKEEVQAAFYNVLLMAKENAEQHKIKNAETADDFIAQKSIIIVEYVRDMIKNTPEDAPDLSK